VTSSRSGVAAFSIFKVRSDAAQLSSARTDGERRKRRKRRKRERPKTRDLWTFSRVESGECRVDEKGLGRVSPR